jgi:curved DNA-binding protein CbpA
MNDDHLRDAYHTLGLEPGTSLPLSRLAYQRLARAFHPDKNPDLGKEGFQRIHSAYKAILHYHQKRQRPTADAHAPVVANQADQIVSTASNRRIKKRSTPEKRRFESISETDYKGVRLKIEA